MPRVARVVSETGYYHVVINGNGKWILFEDDLDRRTFLDFLKSRTERWGVNVIAWCLMDTHVHLLFADFDGMLSKVMQSLMTIYAKYFNQRTGRTGHLFEDRYWSKCIESDGQLLEAVRYIHSNPSNAGICASADYKWSSYDEYCYGQSVCDTGMILEMLNGPSGFIKFCAMREKSLYNPFMGHKIPQLHEMTVARAALSGEDPGKIGALDAINRNQAIRAMSGAGLSGRQIARLTGVGRWTISSVLACHG